MSNNSKSQEDFIKMFAKELGNEYSQAKAKLILDTFIKTLGKIMQEGSTVSLSGFAKFEGKHKDASIARNPKTGEKTKVPAKTVPHVSFFKSCKDKVNNKEF